jgi:hypothetical protein
LNVTVAGCGIRGLTEILSFLAPFWLVEKKRSSSSILFVSKSLWLVGQSSRNSWEREAFKDSKEEHLSPIIFTQAALNMKPGTS